MPDIPTFQRGDNVSSVQLMVTGLDRCWRSTMDTVHYNFHQLIPSIGFNGLPSCRSHHRSDYNKTRSASSLSQLNVTGYDTSGGYIVTEGQCQTPTDANTVWVSSTNHRQCNREAIRDFKSGEILWMRCSTVISGNKMWTSKSLKD